MSLSFYFVDQQRRLAEHQQDRNGKEVRSVSFTTHTKDRKRRVCVNLQYVFAWDDRGRTSGRERKEEIKKQNKRNRYKREGGDEKMVGVWGTEVAGNKVPHQSGKWLSFLQRVLWGNAVCSLFISQRFSTHPPLQHLFISERSN